VSRFHLPYLFNSGPPPLPPPPPPPPPAPPPPGDDAPSGTPRARARLGGVAVAAALVAFALAALVAGSVAASFGAAYPPSLLGAASTSAASFASASTGAAAAAAAAGVEKLPILIVAAGIEGSGHHMLAGVLDKAIASGRVARFNPWFQQLGGDVDGDYDRDAVRAEVLRASEPLRSTSDRAAVFYLDPSYPYSDPARNQPRHALQRPDLSAVLTTLAGAFDVRLVVLRRDPSRLNLLRFDPDRLTAAKIYDDNLSYLQAELTGFVPRFCRDMNGKSADATHNSEAAECGCHKVLDYDAFLADPEAKVGALARWVGLEAEALDADAARGTGHEYDRGSDVRDKRAWAKFDEQHRWKWGAIFEPKEGCVIAG